MLTEHFILVNLLNNYSVYTPKKMEAERNNTYTGEHEKKNAGKNGTVKKAYIQLLYFPFSHSVLDRFSFVLSAWCVSIRHPNMKKITYSSNTCDDEHKCARHTNLNKMNLLNFQ